MNMQKLMKEAQKAQRKMAEAQEKLATAIAHLVLNFVQVPGALSQAHRAHQYQEVADGIDYPVSRQAEHNDGQQREGGHPDSRVDTDLAGFLAQAVLVEQDRHKSAAIPAITTL